MLKNGAVLLCITLYATLADGQFRCNDSTTDDSITFQSTTPGLDGFYLSYKNELGFIIPFEDNNVNFQWRLVPGLANENYYSIESVSYPGRFLRHQGYRIKLHLDDGSDLFKEDATWAVREPSSGQVRFESYNYMGHFLRHYNYELWLGSGNGESFHSSHLFLEDSTYNVHAISRPDRESPADTLL